MPWNFIEDAYVERIDDRGSLRAIESKDFNFLTLRRIYEINQEPHTVRGMHAHLFLNQVVYVLDGMMEIFLEDNLLSSSFLLNRESPPVIIKPITWRKIVTYNENCKYLILADRVYSENDYIRSYDEFKKY